MIDTAKWIEEFRSKDKTNWVNIEFDLEAKLIDEKYPPCTTCNKPRPDISQPCSFCGEIDS